MHQPKVSIIIPVYNGSNYMREAIDSALSQTYHNIEIIVINDGSNDGGKTRNIALSYGDRIRYFEKENGGVASALNMGIEKMEGEYFSWLSHDDLYLPSKIEKEIAALEKTEEKNTPVYCGYYIYDMKKREKQVQADKRERYSLNYFENGTLATVVGLINGCGLLIHKSCFEKYGLFDETLYTTQDYDMWFRMFRGKKLIYVDESLIVSRRHNSQGSVTIDNYDEECDLLDYKIIDGLNESDINQTDISLYELLCLAMVACGNYGHAKAYYRAKERLKELEEPQNARIKRIELKEYILKEVGRKLFLYCAGKRGKTLLEALLLRGIDIEGFSDSDENKWNCVIHEKKCTPPKMIPRDSTIIVTKDDPYDLVNELKEMGYANVCTYYGIEQIIMETPVDKHLLKTSLIAEI